MQPHEHLILFAHPRSGSSSLCRILQCHPELHVLVEPFHENFTRWQPGNPNYLERIHDIPSLDVQLAEIFATYNGIKVLDYQLDNALAVHMLQRSDCKIIFLRRRNLLQAVVSVLIAHQTQLWKKWDMSKPLEEYYQALQPLDIADVQRRVCELKHHLDYFEPVLDTRTDNAVIKLIHEELYFVPPARQHEQIAMLWQLLELAPVEPEHFNYYLRPEAVKLNSLATYSLLPNATAIQQQCGNDVTGWLFPLET